MLRYLIYSFIFKMAIGSDLQVKYSTMELEEFIDYFNNQNFTYKIGKYNRTFNFAVNKQKTVENGCLESCTQFSGHVPKNFDARQRWPQCQSIKEVYEQGDCGTGWHFAIANTASDRTCIHKNVHVHLAEQDFECASKNVCRDSDVKSAFDFWKEKGLVTDKCKPYNIEELNKTKCNMKCVDEDISYEKDKHYAEKVYKVCGKFCDYPDNIQVELSKFGPVQATFDVYEDFLLYKEGIYENKFGKFKGVQSVRVIGYGEEDGIEYWLAANSFGTDWGDKGFFKIKTYSTVKFEEDMHTGIPNN